jgi:hypothetical protein
MAQRTTRPQEEDRFVIEKFVFRLLLKGVLALLLVAAIAYLVDYAIWRTRVGRGGGMGQVEVELFTVAELKGSKEDFYSNGTAMIDCSKSLYPQGGNQACWWLQRHPSQVQRY